MTPDFNPYITEKTENFTGREWVFEKVNNWLADPEGSRVFLLTGGPGTGKSAVVARLAQMSMGLVDVGRFPYLGKDSITYCHFCQAQRDPTLNPLRFVEGLSCALANRFTIFNAALRQMLQSQREITINQNVDKAATGSYVIGMIIQSIEIRNLSARAAFDCTVRWPLEKLYSPDFNPIIVILVDSLDEALTFGTEDNIVTLLADAIRSKQNLPKQVRLLLTSRPDQRRVLDLVGEPSLDLVKNTPDDIDDVRTYSIHRLNLIPEPARTDLADRIAAAGNGNEKGNFLYARYVLDNLTARPEALANPEILVLPKGLDDIYRQFTRRELARNEERWSERYRPLLGLLAVARSPGLTRDHLSACSGLPPSKTDDTLAACIQYLTGSLPNGPFMLYHQSFREFLLKDDQYSVYPTEAEQAIGELFLQAYGEDWKTCEDGYALLNTPGHLARAARAITQPLKRNARRKLEDELHTLLETRSFIDQHLKILEKPYLLLDELRLALNLALENDDLTQSWRHIREYRRIVFDQLDFEKLITAVETANRTGDYNHVIERTTLYGYMPNSQALARLWIAWNAAASGHTNAAQFIIKDALEKLPPSGSAFDETLQRLLIRIYQAAQYSVASDIEWLRQAMSPSHMSTFDLIVGRLSEPLTSWGMMFDAEHTNISMDSLFQKLMKLAGRFDRDTFVGLLVYDYYTGYFCQRKLAACLFNSRHDPIWLEHVKRTVKIVSLDDYPSYREMALFWIAAATLAHDDTALASEALASVLGGMFKPSPGFWGDTVAAAMEGMEQENNHGPDSQYLLSILEHVEATGERGIDLNVYRKMPEIMEWRRSIGLPEDPWSFRMRRHSAVATVLHRRGDNLDAETLLQKAIDEPHEGSYAGYRSLARLSLACRLLEWRRIPEALKQTYYAREDADHVHDRILREERVDMVDKMCKWITEYGQNSNSLNKDEALAQLQRKTGLERWLFIEFLSALWSNKASSLKRLLPLSLDDATTTDAVLGRLLAVEALQAKPGRPFLELVKALQIDTGIENVQTVSKNKDKGGNVVTGISISQIEDK